MQGVVRCESLRRIPDQRFRYFLGYPADFGYLPADAGYWFSWVSEPADPRIRFAKHPYLIIRTRVLVGILSEYSGLIRT